MNTRIYYIHLIIFIWVKFCQGEHGTRNHTKTQRRNETAILKDETTRKDYGRKRVGRISWEGHKQEKFPESIVRLWGKNCPKKRTWEKKTRWIEDSCWKIMKPIEERRATMQRDGECKHRKGNEKVKRALRKPIWAYSCAFS